MLKDYSDKDIPVGVIKVSSAGEILSLSRKYSRKEQYLSQEIDKDGYCIVNLGYNSKKLKRKVHRLVAICFLDNPLNYKEVNHIDGNKSNNILSNLEWCSTHDQQYHKSIISDKKLPPGVSKIGSKFQSRFTINGKTYHLGTFSDPEQAYKAYQKEKDKHCVMSKY